MRAALRGAGLGVPMPPPPCSGTTVEKTVLFPIESAHLAESVNSGRGIWF